MFDRLILGSDYNRIVKRFNMASLADSSCYVPTYNATMGDKCYVILDYQKKEIQQFQFGLKIKNQIVPFVRAEGDRNINDDPRYSGSKAIFLKTEFKNIIRKQRCLVLADAFVVGVDNMNPYLVYLRDKKRPFAFAGIWDKLFDEETGEDIYSFAIITIPANKLMQQLGQKRMPVILFPEYESSWLRSLTQLSTALSMLNPYPINLMNAYPISDKIADKTINDKTLVLSSGKPVLIEQDYSRIKRTRKNKENHFPNITLADMMKRD